MSPKTKAEKSPEVRAFVQHMRTSVEAALSEPHVDAATRRALAKELIRSRDEARAHADKFPGGRREGSPNKATEALRAHIRDLLTKYPGATTAQLRKKAKPEFVGDTSDKTFADHVRALRKK